MGEPNDHLTMLPADFEREMRENLFNRLFRLEGTAKVVRVLSRAEHRFGAGLRFRVEDVLTGERFTARLGELSEHELNEMEVLAWAASDARPDSTSQTDTSDGVT